ncbi:hypothetical protein [Aeromonas caviae]|uniref:hypothetical protein n=1 Tax=Aeromonas caviae TaxID=648 RepID=UPI002B4649E2|nr:hypothetical protein [Aeromonas caviae]
MVASMYEHRQKKAQLIELTRDFSASQKNEQTTTVVEFKENNKKKKKARDILLLSAQKLGW